jgi:chromosome segregation ATPase
MDKTLKLPSYSDPSKKDVSQEVAEKDRNISLELEKKSLLLEEERSKSHELLKTIVQLRESLKQEQTKTTELQARLNKLDEVEESQLAKKNAQLEEEKKKYLEQTKLNEQLREGLRQEQASHAEMAKKVAELKFKLNKLADAEENQLVKKDTLLDEEKKRSLDYKQTIEQLRESIKKDQVKKTELIDRAEVLDAKIKELSVVLSKIASLATGGKVDIGA